MPFVKLSNVKKAYEWELERRKKEKEKKEAFERRHAQKVKAILEARASWRKEVRERKEKERQLKNEEVHPSKQKE
jgi:hypothetical protein